MIFTTFPCMVCGLVSKLELDDTAFRRWRENGELVQKVFPDMSPDQRELLITGTHSECWDTLYAEEAE